MGTFTCLMANCKYVVTDSGGLQEESTALDIPCFTLRENTERPSTLIEKNGTNQLIHKISEIELKECKSSMDLWDGKSSERIYERLEMERQLKYRMGYFYDKNETYINQQHINSHSIKFDDKNTDEKDPKYERTKQA